MLQCLEIFLQGTIFVNIVYQHNIDISTLPDLKDIERKCQTDARMNPRDNPIKYLSL